MIPFLVTLMAIAAVLLGAWAASATVETRRNTDRSLRAVGVYGVDVRREEMVASIAERVLVPVTRALNRLGRYLCGPGYLESVKRKLVLAGNPPTFELDRFLTLKALGAVSVLGWFAVVFVVLGAGGLVGWALFGLLSALGVFGPDLALQQRVERRRVAIERTLPDLLDLLVISVEAGLGFEQALERTGAAVPGPLAEEMRRTLQETRMGASRGDALRALAERTQVDDVQTFVLAMLQADSFGISIARILRSQADEMRTRAHQRAQTQAQKAPVKMLFPLAVCIFPALFIVLLMPALINIFEAL